MSEQGPPQQPPPQEPPPPTPVPPPYPQRPTSPTLYRSRRDRVLAGVCGGLADYLGADATLVRVIAVVIALLPGPAILAYIIAWLVIPEEPYGDPAAPRPPRAPSAVGSDSARYIAGAVLIGIGGLWLMATFLPGLFDLRILLPLVLVGLGIALLVQGARK